MRNSKRKFGLISAILLLFFIFGSNTYANVTISGKVTDTHNNPLEQVCVDAYTAPCPNGDPVATGISDVNGNYSINIEPESYYIHTHAGCSRPHPVLDEWWNGAVGTNDCNQAVLLPANSNQAGINFELDDMPDYPAPVIQYAGLMSRVRANGNLVPFFFLFLSGPSPDDVYSCQAAFPDGATVNMSPYIDERQRGHLYVAGPGGNALVDGTYTFTVTDTKGRSTDVIREFHDENPIPGIVESSRQPADQAYVGTTTPMLSFDPVSGSNYGYKVYVMDYDSKSIWYSSEVITETSVTVPEGFLQPNTAYKWFVRVFDGTDYASASMGSCQESELHSFYTGTGNPSLDNCFVVNVENNGSQGGWFGVRNANIAPWDIQSLTVTAPDGTTIYDLDVNDYFFYKPSYYSKLVSGLSLVDGVYRFSLTTTGGTITKDVLFTKNSLPYFSNFEPATNTYFGSHELTFSWDSLGSGYHYRVRLTSWRGMKWYESELVTGTSVSIPVAGNLAVGSSYMWQIIAFDDPDNPNNMTTSETRTCTIADAPLAADFNSTPCNGTAPLAVDFTECAQGNVITWNWDFDGDGDIDSTERYPSHTYNNPGNYTVKLQVADNYSNKSDTQTKTNYIEVAAPEQPPVVAFTASPVSGVSPLTVNFTDQSTGDITSWNWDFDDDEVIDSTVQNPSHSYNTPGNYAVTLTASGPGGGSTVKKIDLVTAAAPAQPPVAKFSAAPLSEVAPCVVNFIDESAGEVTIWQWDFGDGATGSQRNPAHTYANAGVYSVTLTVSGIGGDNTETKTHYITITNPVTPPLARFTAEPANGVSPHNVTFTDASTGDITSWSWDFGDGNTSTDPNPVHIYSAAGTYDVALAVTGPGGNNTAIKTNCIVVTEPAVAPIADFTTDNRYGIITSTNQSHNVSFTDTSTGDINSWSWDFGDGSSSTAKNPTHVYSATGTYNVTLTVTGPGGNNDETKNGYIIVEIDNTPPTAIVTNAPPARTNQGDFELVIGGNEVVSYKYQLDTGSESPVYIVSEACSLSFGPYEDGSHILNVYGCDGVGNWQLVPTPIIWTIDRTPPTAKLNGAPQGVVGTNQIDIQINGTVEDVAFYRYKLDNGEWSFTIKSDIHIELTGLADENHTLSVIGSDDLGNWQAETDATVINWRIDTSVSTATLSNLPPVESNITEHEISVAGNDVVVYQYRITGPAAAYNGNWSAETDISDAIAFTVAADGSDDGDYTLEVIGKNSVNTWQAEVNATTYAWTVDTTVPSHNIDVIPSLGVPPSSAINLSWKPVENGLLEYQVRIAKDSWSNWESASEVHCNLVPGPSNGIFSEIFTIENLLSGTTYHVAIRSVDQAGNISGDSDVEFIATFNLTPGINSFALIDLGGTSADNSESRSLEVTGSNFLSGAANIVRFIQVDGNVVFEKDSSIATFTSLTVVVPAGTPVGEYHLRVTNINGSSEISDDIYEVTAAPLPVPEVVNLDPPMLPVGNNATITVNGSNFTDGTTQPSTVSLVAESGLEIPLEIGTVAADTLTAVVTNMAPVGIYDVRVTLVDRFNESSNVKLEIYQPIEIDEASGSIETTGGIELGEGDSAGTIPVEVTLQSENDGGTASANDNCVEIEANFEPGTKITADGQPYTGTIDPPRQIPPTEDIVDRLGDDIVVFTMGNPDERLDLVEGQSIVVTFNAVVENGNDAPIIYYLEVDGSLSVAGINGSKDGLEYVPGGIILGILPDSPITGFTNHTIGVLLDHMSDYAIAAPSMVINSVGSGSGPDTGGNTVNITGINFVPGMTVTFGGIPATDVQFISSTWITCVVPMHNPGVVQVVLTNPNDDDDVISSYEYLADELIPTLNEWGMLILVLILSGEILIHRRRQT